MKSIEYMHYVFGSGHPSDKCGDCKNLVRHVASRTWYKCKVYGETSSEASDWRKKWNSCGMFNMTYNGIPVMEMKKHLPKAREDYNIEGQMSIFDIYGNGTRDEN